MKRLAMAVLVFAVAFVSATSLRAPAAWACAAPLTAPTMVSFSGEAIGGSGNEWTFRLLEPVEGLGPVVSVYIDLIGSSCSLETPGPEVGTTYRVQAARGGLDGTSLRIVNIAGRLSVLLPQPEKTSVPAASSPASTTAALAPAVSPVVSTDSPRARSIAPFVIAVIAASGVVGAALVVRRRNAATLPRVEAPPDSGPEPGSA
jgi:hypothetical protein